jgi:hypothetical protein
VLAKYHAQAGRGHGWGATTVSGQHGLWHTDRARIRLVAHAPCWATRRELMTDAPFRRFIRLKPQALPRVL